ncbi:methionyl-tRNA formyltransferase [Candidatus Pelagibacter sp. Uisw_099_02]|uniref:methionyl-tRNA formyltransferase n=1 Tax=Candidatus Pelagibacter sp. Uisw_099_02 TaxID=3230981 RepID=UPI002372532E|nr:methionyl-tRNA formyltransferase [Candidatus Pelagibacter sp.]
MLKKIVFMGTPFFAVPILKSLYQNGYSVSVVYTQPPQKSQRGQRINKSPIQGISETLKIEYRTPISLKNNKEEYNYLKELDADIAIVVAYGQIIPKEYLSLVKKGFINIHASLLPKWRGAAPIQRSIMKLEKETGISIMKIGEKLDAGPVCNSYKIEIKINDNSETIAEKLSALAAEKILDNIDEILEDKIEFKEQNNNEATYAAKIEKIEGQIEWDKAAENIIGKINGLYPSPGAFFIYNGERYKILKASLAYGSGEIGEVLDSYLEVSCGNKKSIKILEIQRQGKRPQNIGEFMLGSQIKKGSNLNNA